MRVIKLLRYMIWGVLFVIVTITVLIVALLLWENPDKLLAQVVRGNPDYE